jgi:hypothetical protein
VPDRTSQTPGVAVSGQFVAVAWTAAGADYLADIYAASSHDGGATFDPPVRVNDVAGDVRASEQQAPRVAIGDGMLAVLWTARRGSDTTIRLAISTDEGRSFGASTQVSAPGAPGTRGWGSIAIDAQRRIHVLWLDTKIAAATAAPSPAADPAAPHVHGGAAHAEMRQDIYEAIVDADGEIREHLVATGVCFCCKTAIVRQGEAMWGAWRDVYPGTLRDISFARLDGPGDVAKVRVSEDHWQINACPEDGPSLAAGGDRIDIVWPTQVDSQTTAKGVFAASTADGRTFTSRFRMDGGAGSASHPAIAAGPAGSMAVWQVAGPASQQIEARRRTGSSWESIEAVATGTVSSPVVSAAPRGFIVAWASGTGIAVAQVTR